MAQTYPIQLSYTSFVITIFTLTLTLLNLLYLYHQFIGTIRNAPHEIREALGNLRQQICEEREALKRQTRVVRAQRDFRRQRQSNHHHQRHHSYHHDGRRHGPQQDFAGFNYDEALTQEADYSAQTLSLHYATLRDIWRRFKTLERPFLVSNPARAEAIHRGDAWAEDDLVDDEKVRADVERRGGDVGDGESSFSMADWTGVYICDFSHRFIWWQSKGDVQKLADLLQKVMMARILREVTRTKILVEELVRQKSGVPGVNGGRSRGGWVVERRTENGNREREEPGPRAEAMNTDDRDDYRTRAAATERRRGRSTDEWVVRRHYR
ncbi:hypothetical protein F5Y16DRAFT_284542 [Xylariaceae sp. FL0255]|nr:hypothetical protein F5Y16DRAFT_284542 [Xylariaceae sp. FL0255]